jgi:tRNA-2-methylthio-N6-dimethylallyladenosine synthase
MGCQMNAYDSDYLGQCLQTSGFFPCNSPEKADVIIINTCTVRAKAQQKAYSTIGRMVMLKKQKTTLTIGLVGCMAQQEGRSLLKRFPDLDFILGTRELGKIFDILCQNKKKRNKVVAVDLEKDIPSQVNHKNYFLGRVASHVSIMEGCDNFCSYCIVPYVRGREVCRSPYEIIHEVENLVTQGVKEVTLLGQNVNSYVWVENGGIPFAGLLKMLNKLDGLVRIRFTTSHPKDLSDDLINCFQELEHLCPHIHLPLQAGSDRVLKMMNRGYTSEKYLELIGKLRLKRPDMAITSDIIVGFPGESNRDFKKTLDLIQKIEFDSLFSFKYSDRKGTPAAKMENKVDEDEKSMRLSMLQALQKNITLQKNKRLEGANVEVLVEGNSKKGQQFSGRTVTNKIVNFNCKTDPIHQLVHVRIDHAHANSLHGVVVA